MFKPTVFEPIINTCMGYDKGVKSRGDQETDSSTKGFPRPGLSIPVFHSPLWCSGDSREQQWYPRVSLFSVVTMLSLIVNLIQARIT